MNDAGQKSGASTSVALIIHAVLLSAALVFIGLKISELGKSENLVAQALAKQSRSGTAASTVTGVTPGIRASAPAQGFNQSNIDTSFGNDHILGPVGAPIALITYMDFQCPYCKKFYPVAKQFVQSSQGQVKFIIRQYPLPMHNQADFLANVSECVAQQKGNTGFWDFADRILMGGPFDYSNETFVAPVLAALHVDNSKYQDCMRTKTFQAKIDAFAAEGRAIGVTGTPTHVMYDSATKKAIFKAGAIPLEQLQSELQSLQRQ